MKIYKNYDGRKIEKCKDCGYIHISTSHLYWSHCINIDKNGNGYLIDGIENKGFPPWCPLPDYKGEDK